MTITASRWTWARVLCRAIRDPRASIISAESTLVKYQDLLGNAIRECSGRSTRYVSCRIQLYWEREKRASSPEHSAQLSHSAMLPNINTQVYRTCVRRQEKSCIPWAPFTSKRNCVKVWFPVRYLTREAVSSADTSLLESSSNQRHFKLSPTMPSARTCRRHSPAWLLVLFVLSTCKLLMLGLALNRRYARLPMNFFVKSSQRLACGTLKWMLDVGFGQVSSSPLWQQSQPARH